MLNQLRKDLSASLSLGGSVFFSIDSIRNRTPFDWVILGSPELSELQKLAKQFLGTVVVESVAGVPEISLARFEELGIFDYCVSVAVQRELAEMSREDLRVDPSVESRQFNFPLQVTYGVQGNQTALFLDRDGVIIEDTGYVSSPKDVKLMPRVVEHIQQARKEQRKVIVVTNQSGIARKYFSWNDLSVVNRRMLDLLGKQNCQIDDIFVSPFHSSSVIVEHRLQPYLRKPRPGMIVAAARKHGIDLSLSTLIGDSPRDLRAAELAGIPNRILWRKS